MRRVSISVEMLAALLSMYEGNPDAGLPCSARRRLRLHDTYASHDVVDVHANTEWTPMSERRRIIVATADAFEGAAIYDGLSAHGFEPVWRSTIQAAADEMRSRPFDLLIADAAFAFSGGLQDEGRRGTPLLRPS